MRMSTGRRRASVTIVAISVVLGTAATAGIVSGIPDLAYSPTFYLYQESSTGVVSPLGPLASLSGCSTYAPVVEQSLSATDTKQLGTKGFNPCVIDVGYDMSAGFYDWIDAAWHGTYEARDLWIVTIPQGPGSSRSKIVVADAVIGNVSLPRVETGSDTSTFIRVELLHSGVTFPASCCQTLSTPRDIFASPLVASRYRIAMTNPDLPTQKTREVETYEVKNARSGCESSCPGNRAIFSDVKAFVSTVDAQSYNNYFKDFVVDGQSGDDNEGTFTIEWLTSDFSTTLLTARLEGTGIYYIDPYPLKGSTSRVRFNLYVEQANIKKGAP